MKPKLKKWQLLRKYLHRNPKYWSWSNFFDLYLEGDPQLREQVDTWFRQRQEEIFKEFK